MMERFENSEELEGLLSQPSQQFVAGVVKTLHDEEPSLAWRSGLNEQIRVLAGLKRARRTRMQWFWAGSASLAALAAIGAVMLRPAPTAEISLESESGTLEAQMIQSYHEDKLLKEESSINQVSLAAMSSQQTSTSDPLEEVSSEDI